MEQKGNDDEGVLGFLTEDMQKEIRRGKRLVHILEVTILSYLLIIIIYKYFNK